jgi:hypothetical protein
MVERDWQFSWMHGHKAIQNGWKNTVAVIDWAYENLGKDRTLDSLVIAGQVGGAPAAQGYGGQILKKWTYENSAIIADSFSGVLPFGTDGRMAIDYNVCNTGMIPGNFTQFSAALGEGHWLQSLFMVPDILQGAAARWACKKGLLMSWLSLMGNTQQFKDTVNAQIMSKTDLSQTSAYDVITFALFGGRTMVSNSDFYDKVIEAFDRYAVGPLKVDNFVPYMINDQVTGYLDKKRLYDVEMDGVKLSTWLKGIPVRRGETLKGVCDTSTYGEYDKIGFCECWEKCPKAAENEFYRPHTPAPTDSPTPEPTPPTPRPTTPEPTDPPPTASPTEPLTAAPTKKGETAAPTKKSETPAPTKALGGACTPSDWTVIRAAGSGTNASSFPKKLSVCGLKSFSLWSGFLQAKMKTCILESFAGIGAACADCYVQAGAYGAEHCKMVCLSSWCSEACLACSAKNSDAVRQCAGGDAPAATVCKQGDDG